MPASVAYTRLAARIMLQSLRSFLTNKIGRMCCVYVLYSLRRLSNDDRSCLSNPQDPYVFFSLFFLTCRFFKQIEVNISLAKISSDVWRTKEIAFLSIFFFIQFQIFLRLILQLKFQWIYFLLNADRKRAQSCHFFIDIWITLIEKSIINRYIKKKPKYRKN